ncbi:MAG: TIGR03617 family F420-dependent LLM class oxidoreductase [Acidimicrobiales bacterium]|jgi:probable F420-dependent oxidoreductase
MKLDGAINSDLRMAGEGAKSLEAAGYSGAWSVETQHDPFLPLTLAAEHTSTLEIGTSIAVAFARNPMLLANLGYDLNAYSEGRMMMGLGSQIKPHITKRFSMEWSRPAARMREMIIAIHAIWDAWETGDKLRFRGDFYTHILMTPFFDPGPNPHGKARIFLAAVGELMLETTGEVADGWISHGFTTPGYLKEVALPALERGAAKSGRTLSDIEISLPSFVVTGTTEEEMAAAAQATKQQIAFYGSTPSYKGVLDHHGWGDAQPELNLLSKRGDWVAMADLIDDTMLAEFAVIAEPEHVAAGLAERYGGHVDRISFYAPYATDPDRWTPVINDILAI